MSEQSVRPTEAMRSVNRGAVGHMYAQTNELRNAIVHDRLENGRIEEIDRVSRGAAGSGVFKPTNGQESAPNAFEGSGSVILSPDRLFLFTTNGGDNSVSSFSGGEDGRLTLLDVRPTGNPVEGRSGNAKSPACTHETGTLYVLHSFGQDHLRLTSVTEDGKRAGRAGAVYREHARQAGPRLHDGRAHNERPLRLCRPDLSSARASMPTAGAVRQPAG